MPDSSRRVRIAVAGLGRMGQRHARNAAAAAGIDLIAVADVDEARAAALGTELGVPGYSDAGRMLDEAGPQGLVIATPPATHVRLIELAAARSIHVLCEKPLSFDGPEAVRALGLAAEAGIAIQLGFQMRFDEDLTEIAEYIARGESGALGLLETSRVAGYGFESGFELLGSEATCRVAGGRAGGVDLYRDGAIVARHRRDFLERFGPAYPRELAGFADVVAGACAPRVSGLDGLAAMRLCEAAVRSYERGETV